MRHTKNIIEQIEGGRLEVYVVVCRDIVLKVTVS